MKKGRCFVEERLKEGFYARFLGGFSLKFAGQEMLFDVNPQGKTMQLIYFLLKSGAKIGRAHV